MHSLHLGTVKANEQMDFVGVKLTTKRSLIRIRSEATSLSCRDDNSRKEVEHIHSFEQLISLYVCTFYYHDTVPSLLLGPAVAMSPPNISHPPTEAIASHGHVCPISVYDKLRKYGRSADRICSWM